VNPESGGWIMRHALIGTFTVIVVCFALEVFALPQDAVNKNVAGTLSEFETGSSKKADMLRRYGQKHGVSEERLEQYE